jgi:hypothetical protein
MQKMLKFHRKVNPNEGILGLYISCKKLDEHGQALVQYFNDLFMAEQKKALLNFPLIMMVDPTLSENKLSVKVRYLFTLSSSNLPALIDTQPGDRIPAAQPHLL